MRKILLILLMIILAICISACSMLTQHSNESEDQVLTQEPIEKELIPDPPVETGKTSYDNTQNQPDENLMTSYDKITDYLQQEIEASFTPHYEVLGSKISNYEESVLEDGTVEALFVYAVIYKNHDKDPDTVGYIKSAKESNHPYYQIYYDEYLEPKEGTFPDLKAIINNDGEITLYTDIDPHSGREWVVF